MAEKREYTIQINGLKESYDGVVSLKEALESITDTVVKVSKEEEKTASDRKASASATDALAKATQKLEEFDKAYQTELAKVNAELSANKKEINEAIKLQQAQDVVEAKQLDTYRDKQTYLSALNTLIRNHSTATEEDVQAIDKMVQESAQLQAELKATDEQMQIYVRNVGNYNGAAEKVVESHKSVKSELKELKAEMADMLANGVSKTDEGYLKLAERAGQLKDAMQDANADIANFASDTQGMTNVINLASSAVNMWQLYNSAMTAFGIENEEAGESMKKMMAIMTLLNSLQQVQNSLLENGSATGRLYSKAVEMIQSALGLKKAATEEDIAATETSTAVSEANAAAQESNAVAQEVSAAAAESNTVSTTLNTTAEEANTVATGTNSGALGTNSTALQANAAASNTAATATNTMSTAQKAGAVASKTLSTALKAIPLMAIIGLVMTLIQNWESIWNWFKKTFPILDTLSQKFNKFGGFMNTIKTGAKALGAAIVNWIINPFKTFANVIGKILEGDFAGAWQAAVDGINNQFKGTMDAFNNELEKGYARGQEEMTAKAAEESNKRTQQELEELKIQERNNKTYSKKYIDLQQKDFDERKKMAKGNQEELNKIKLEEMQFYADVEDKKTAYANEQNKKRTKSAEKAAKEAKKAAEEARKDEEKEEKERQEHLAKTIKTIEDLEKLVVATNKRASKQMDVIYKEEAKRYAVYSQKYADDFVKMSNFATETSKKAEEVKKLIFELLGDATDSELSMLRGYYDTLEAESGYFNYRMLNDVKKAQESIQQVDYFLAHRKEIAINDIAEQAKAIKDEYLKQIDYLEGYIKQLEEDSKKQSGEKLEETKKTIQKARDEITKAKESMDRELGEYANKEIKIPVNIDLHNLKARYDQMSQDMNGKLAFSFNQVIDSVFGAKGAIEDLYNSQVKLDAESKKEGKETEHLFETFRDLGNIVGMSKEELESFLKIVTDSRPFSEKASEIQDFVSRFDINISRFGLFSKEATDKLKALDKEVLASFTEQFNEYVKHQDKVISFNEKAIKRFQDASKGLKLEPVMDDDFFSGILKGQIIDLDKTRDRYDKLKASYKEYQESLKVGSEQRQAYEEAWEKKLSATANQLALLKKVHGEESLEYKNAAMEYELLQEDKKKADAAYAMEYEKVTKQLEDLNKKQADLVYDYIKSISDRWSNVINTFQDNVMSPIFDAMGDYFSLQVEEAQDALDEIEELLDKATEAREKSADRVKEINDEIKNSDASNKANLEQQLADEQVLLVQREEAERALEKEKKKREYEVKQAEFNQRKFELKQKLIEGVVNTALGMTAALKYGPILGPIFAAIIGAMGAVQTAIIAKQIGNLKQPQKYAKGGLIGEEGISRSHSQGGHRVEGTNIEVEGGEWVINKKSSNKYDDLLRAINEDNTLVIRKEVSNIHNRRTANNVKSQISRYANGGRLDTVNTVQAVQANSDVSAISELIKQIDMQPVVSVVDINRKQKNLVKVTDLAGKR